MGRTGGVSFHPWNLVVRGMVVVVVLLGAVLVNAPARAEPAREIHERLLVLDSHLDTPALLAAPGWDVTERHDPLRDYSQVDLPRMVEGGLDGGFWVIYTPQGPVTDEGFVDARDHALMRGIAIREMIARHDAFELALTADDAGRIVAAGRRPTYISVENAYPIGKDLTLINTFYEMGVRMMGPVHFSHNQLASSSTDEADFPVDGPDANLGGGQGGGLSALGKAFVAECNRLGIVIDASHASDAALDDMLALSKTPIILSHSGPDGVFDHPRNVDDTRLKRLAETGGVIQINAFGAYLKQLPADPARRKAFGALISEFRRIENPAAEDYRDFIEKRRVLDERFPPARADFEDFMAHLLYALDLLGPDHVGIGADWDGGGGVTGMEDVSALPRITDRLLAEGYSEDDLAKIWSGNLLRVLRAAETHAASLKASETPPE